MSKSVVPEVQYTPHGGGGSNSTSDFPLSLNTIYAIIAFGVLVLITATVAIMLSIVYVCKAWKKRVERSTLKRNNTTRSSNTSDFIYNTAYEWTCRQTRLLSHLRPDTTGYQSHWSLTRDVPKRRVALQQLESFQGRTTPTIPEVPVTGQENVGDTEREDSGLDAKNIEVCVNGECVTHYSLNRDRNFEIPRKLAVIHEGNTSSDNFSDTTDLASDIHAKLDEGVQQDDNNTTESLHARQPSTDNSVDMYNNPLYAKRRRDSESARERGREVWQVREKKDSVRKEEEELSILQSSTAYYSLSTKAFSSFLIPDNDAYDSGNASAVSTDISINTNSTTRRSDATWSAGCKTGDSRDSGKESRGIVESNSFECSNNSPNIACVM